MSKYMLRNYREIRSFQIEKIEAIFDKLSFLMKNR